MAILLLQLGDIHIKTANDPIIAHTAKISAATAAEAPSAIDQCCIIMTGDAVNSGEVAQFDAAQRLLTCLKDDLQNRLKCPVQIVTVPGNHDIYLGGDQTARDQIINSIANADLPAESILDLILSAQKNYFNFSKNLASSNDKAITREHPFLRTVAIQSNDGILHLNLVNTAWMCRKGQTPGDLFLPAKSLTMECQTSPLYSISVLHHPFNWFNQPTTLRQIRDIIEHSSDMIITGHEHANSAHIKDSLGTLGVLQYLEGGVLYDPNTPGLSTFAVINIDFANQTQSIVRFSANSEGVYIRQSGAEPTPLRMNISRKDRRFQIESAFREFLDDPDLPLADSKQRAVRLLDIFTYPDLREAVDRGINIQWKRFRGADVLTEILGRKKILIAGGPKSGKTSLAKSLFADIFSRGRLPVYIDGATIRHFQNDSAIRNEINKAIKQQYVDGQIELHEQIGDGRRALIVDNFHEIDNARGARERFVAWIETRFDLIICLADDEFAIEQLYSSARESSKLIVYDHFQLCEFGYLRIEDLARRWLSCSKNSALNNDGEVRSLCKLVSSVLKTNAIPHHPWVLLVLLQEATEGQEIAAKNGSHGHLFQAVITSALYRSSQTNVDIETKFAYLAEFAYHMHSKGVAILDESEVRLFHQDHCDKYDLELLHDDMICDLADVNLLRVDNGRVAFRTKYAYWFFVAWHISRHLHETPSREAVQRLCKGLYHEDTANIFVFLAHLSSDPQILNLIIETAKDLFASAPLADLDKDIRHINELQREEFKIRLKLGDPESNRRQRLEIEDEAIAQRDGTETDGRRVEATAPQIDESADEFTRFIHNLQASLKTIEILGQVLRNGAGSITADEKRRIVSEIYRLGRRIIGIVLHDLPEQLRDWCQMLWNYFEEKYPQDTSQVRLEKVICQVSHTLWHITFCVVRRVSTALAHEMLRKTFQRVLDADRSIPNRLFDLSVKLDSGSGLPTNEAVELFEADKGNYIVRAVVRSLFVNYMNLYKIGFKDQQFICSKLNIELDSKVLDPSSKKSNELITSSDPISRGVDRSRRRKQRKSERERRGK